MKVDLTKKIPEANIQAEFYKQCKDAGINIILEYATKYYDPSFYGQKSGRRKKCRFDCLIYDDDRNAICIVEIKSRLYGSSPKMLKTKQIKRYESFGIPVLLIANMNEVAVGVNKVKKLL